jgi:prephenate dehydrogenase
MQVMVVSVVGLGLIGGSMAKDLKKGKLFATVLGVDKNVEHGYKALELNIVDKIVNLEDAIEDSNLIILAVPVDAANKLATKILEHKNCPIVMDVGSTKVGILNTVEGHFNRGKFVATHPMSGTENSGPEAAISDLFRGKLAIICDSEQSDLHSIKLVGDVYNELGATTISMEAHEHDASAAFVSHISHISSFALALTVLKAEKNKSNIQKMASGGFRTTARLANSNAKTWAPILIENKKNVIDVLDGYVEYMNSMKKAIQNEDRKSLEMMIIEANKVKGIIN